MNFRKYIALRTVFIGMAVLFLLTACNSEKEITLSSEKKYIIDIEGKDAYFEVVNNNEEMSFGLVQGDDVLLLGYLSSDSLELSFKNSNATGETVTIYDNNYDGIPDYKLIKDRKTGRVSKEYPKVTWSEKK